MGILWGFMRMFTLSQIIGPKSKNENHVYNDFNVITVKLLWTWIN